MPLCFDSPEIGASDSPNVNPFDMNDEDQEDLDFGARSTRPIVSPPQASLTSSPISPLVSPLPWDKGAAFRLAAPNFEDDFTCQEVLSSSPKSPPLTSLEEFARDQARDRALVEDSPPLRLGSRTRSTFERGSARSRSGRSLRKFNLESRDASPVSPTALSLLRGEASPSTPRVEKVSKSPATPRSARTLRTPRTPRKPLAHFASPTAARTPVFDAECGTPRHVKPCEEFKTSTPSSSPSPFERQAPALKVRVKPFSSTIGQCLAGSARPFNKSQNSTLCILTLPDGREVLDKSVNLTIKGEAMHFIDTAEKLMQPHAGVPTIYFAQVVSTETGYHARVQADFVRGVEYDTEKYSKEFNAQVYNTLKVVLADVHADGIMHNDILMRNIVVEQAGDGSLLSAHLIDFLSYKNMSPSKWLLPHQIPHLTAVYDLEDDRVTDRFSLAASCRQDHLLSDIRNFQ